MEGAFPVRTATELLAPHESRLRAIRGLAGVPGAHWERLYLALFRAFAGFVQELPASEAHHHAGPGGLLAHGLEAVLHGLQLRRAHLLPQGAAAEELATQQDLWSYATTTAALLHDLGKPVTDQRVALFDRDGASQGAWAPWLGPMPGTARWYRVEFVRGRRHQVHERVAPLLVRFVLPEHGLGWLASNPAVLDAWLAAISGEMGAAGTLGQLVQQADGLSVSGDLAGEQRRLPSARMKPLHERLMTALRYLLAEGEIPLNRPGAAGWVTGDNAWLVSKRVLDRLKEHLAREGQAGIPSRNDRLMDELQQHGLLVPNGDRAVWRVEVAAGDWRQSLTVLRFPAARLWPDPASRPAPFAGDVVPEIGAQIADAEGEEAAGPADGPERAEAGRGVEPLRPPPADAGAPAAPAVMPQSSVPSEASGQDAVTGEPSPDETRAKGRPEQSRLANGSDADDAGERFVEWLCEGLRTGRLKTNAVNARIHTVPEGLLLVTPAIFKDFDPVSWAHVQKRFQKRRLHVKTPQGTNIHTYAVAGERRRSRIKVMLIPEPERALGDLPLPPPNPHLAALGE